MISREGFWICVVARGCRVSLFRVFDGGREVGMMLGLELSLVSCEFVGEE